MTTAASFLAELHENDAPEDIRAIYREIRYLTGVPMVALIWRHLATLLGVLPDTWSSLAPLMRTGVLQETAWQLAEDARIVPLTPLSRTASQGLGLDTSALQAIAAVLDAYNRANPVNMLCVYTLFARLLRPDGQALAPDVVLWEPPAPIDDLPRMYAPAEMTADLRQTLEGLSTQDASANDAVVAMPSLYRHLVPWPGYIGWFAGALRPLLDDGRLAQAIGALRASMAREAEAFVVHVPPSLALQAYPTAKMALTRFSSLIPEMIIVGRLLRQALPDGA